MKSHEVIPYAPILVESTRSIGYSFEAALADIIDNSISNNAKNIDIYFDSLSPQYVAIVDDGCGMDGDRLIDSMRYGSKSSIEERDKNDLGRFGLGLKMASLSQCRKLTVISKANGNICAAQWDLDYIIETSEWTLKYFEEEEALSFKCANLLKDFESGTVVLWENFDRMLHDDNEDSDAFDEKIEIAIDHVALVFHRYLDGENPNQRINITFNKTKVKPKNPFLTSNPATQSATETYLSKDGGKIRVKIYTLPYISKLSNKERREILEQSDLRQNQGFYIYRNKRLIIWGTWFRMIKQHELGKLARVCVDIPNSLDHIWEIDVKKSTASLPRNLREDLSAIVKQAVSKSERVYRYRGRKIQKDDIIHVWEQVDNRGSFSYKINRELPIYQQLEEALPEEHIRLLDMFINTIEDTFPYGDVYYQLAKNENEIPSNSRDEIELYEMGLEHIKYLKSIGMPVSVYLMNLDKREEFINYPNVISKLKEAFGNE